MTGLVWVVIVVLFLFWLFGQALAIGGDLIHLLLVVLVIALIYNLVTGRRRI